MTLTSDEQHFLVTVAKLSYCNPFTAERLRLERQALGSRYQSNQENWNAYVGSTGEVTHVHMIVTRLEPLLLQLRDSSTKDESKDLFDDLVVFLLYHRYRARLSLAVERNDVEQQRPQLKGLFEEFRRDVAYFFGELRTRSFPHEQPEHLFALAFQISRAFFHIYRFIVGASTPMIKLRERIWESIFSADLRRYRRALSGRMNEFPTLITGPSGTGKELVARAIGLSQYIPFDPRVGRFAEDFELNFHPLNLSAFSPTLIESELFGHKRGSFTGAVSDRDGWLRSAGRRGTVFLDEIGELAPEIQVKLLRVIESRSFQRLGDNKSFRFEGKLITATNRHLDTEIAEGRFRADLFFRLIGDRIETPPLQSRVASQPGELELLVRFIAERLLPSEEHTTFAKQAVDWITHNLPHSYAWPGNVRELEQCLRNLIIHGSYTPPRETKLRADGLSALFQMMEDGSIAIEPLVDQYVAHVYQKLNNYEETGRRVGLDRRTVKARVSR